MTEQIFLYSIRSAFVLALLYVPYMLMLRQESFFRLNRMVLLLILLLSLVLPALDVHPLAWKGLAPVHTALQSMAETGDARPEAVMLSEVAVQADAEVVASRSPWQWASMLFVAVMALVALWKVCQVAWMGIEVRRGSLWHQNRDGVHIYCHADEVAPYSWMGSVVISERDYRENGREILLHETAHIRARHSLDLLFLAVVQTLQWWNPLIYIRGGSLRDVHEYEADDSVLRHGVSARAYQILLIKKVVGSGSYAFANNFDHSLIKKRITMMQKTKSSKWMCSKALYLLPMAALALSAFATVVPSRSSEGEVSALTQNHQAKAQESADSMTGRIKSSADYCETPGVMPQYPGGENAFWGYIAGAARYPATAKDLGIQGKVIVEFFVGTDGAVCGVHAVEVEELKGKNPLRQVMVTAYSKDGKAETAEPTAEEQAAYRAGVEALKAEAERVIKAMPKWTPGYVDKAKTKPCITSFSMPFMFRLN